MEIENEFVWQEKGTPWRGVAIYHITVTAVKRNPENGIFGELKWDVEDEQVCNARVKWSELGYGIWDCIQEIPKRYPQIHVCAATIMPDHVHMILHVTERMDTTFNMVLRGWKQGCKKKAKECKIVEPVFSEKPFIRVMTYKGQLKTMMEYVKLNPYRMAVRLAFSGYFAIQRGVTVAGRAYAAVGNLHLLCEGKKWQVHVHKELVWAAEKGDDKALRDYKNQCVLQSRNGAVLVSPFISKDEVEVRDVAMKEKKPIIYILDNGLPDKMKYKPAGYLTEAIGAGRVLILAPWEEYIPNKGHCTREECVAMNKMAEEIVRGAESIGG